MNTNTTARTQVRPEIQALRALAVVLVLVYHLWPQIVPAGYIGVDVFFVISGFLITSHLIREIDRHGNISLIGFWARRARRILPAAFLVLFFCALATWILVPWVYWDQFFNEIKSSVLYVQNWTLAESSIDYLKSDQGYSLVNHFWSLSVEEQFYLIWPVLMIFGTFLVRSKNKLTTHRAIWLVLGIVTVTSLIYSIYLTAADPSSAYFVTFTRAWEFGFGGLLAFIVTGGKSNPLIRSWVSWLGLVAIFGAALSYSDTTPFPGYTALLPIAGTVAIIWAGMPKTRVSPGRLFRIKPIQFTGDISYSIYLWHWPLIVLFPFILHELPNTIDKSVIVIVTFFIAWLTKVFVEDPVRTSKQLIKRKATYTFATALLTSGILFSVALAGSEIFSGRANVEVAQAAKAVATKTNCFGAAARDPENPCSNPKLKFAVVPGLAAAQREGKQYGKCNTPLKGVEGKQCNFGTKGRQAAALIGDSHARHWVPAFSYVAKANNWRGYLFDRSACPLNMAIRTLPEPNRSACINWKNSVLSWLKSHPNVKTIFISASANGHFAEADMNSTDAGIWGYTQTFKVLPKSIKRIIVIKDVPNVVEKQEVECVMQVMSRRTAGSSCVTPRSVAFANTDLSVVAAQRLGSSRVKVIDLTKFFCDSTQCYSIVGGVLVHRDYHHMTAEFSKTLGPYLLREYKKLS